jgi:hypothetical protein
MGATESVGIRGLQDPGTTWNGASSSFCSQEEVSCAIEKAANYLFNGKIVGFHKCIPGGWNFGNDHT